MSIRRRSHNPVDQSLMHKVEFSRSGANAHTIVNLASSYKGSTQMVDEAAARGRTPDPYFVKSAAFYEKTLRKVLAGSMTAAQAMAARDEFERTVESNPMKRRNPHLTIAHNPRRRSHHRRVGINGRRALGCNPRPQTRYSIFVSLPGGRSGEMFIRYGRSKDAVAQSFCREGYGRNTRYIGSKNSYGCAGMTITVKRALLGATEGRWNY